MVRPLDDAIVDRAVALIRDGAEAAAAAASAGISEGGLYKHLRARGLTVRDLRRADGLPDPPLIAGERWRPIPGLESRYHVSDRGRVRSVGAGKAVRFGRILKPAVTRRGLYVRLGTGGQRSVAALVAEAFVGPRPAGHWLRFVNGDNTDARAENLAYSPAGTVLRRSAPRGELHPNAKLSDKDAGEIRRRRLRGASLAELSQAFGVAPSTVSLVANRKGRWAHDQPVAGGRRRTWTAADEQYLVRHLGHPDEEVAAALSRTVTAVKLHRTEMRRRGVAVPAKPGGWGHGGRLRGGMR